MFRYISVILTLFLLGCSVTGNANSDTKKITNGATQVANVGESPSWVIAVHGGSGVKSRNKMTADMEKEYRNVLTLALQKGGLILSKGGSGVDAVEAALIVLEDSPLFNAGRGGAIDQFGRVLHDAAIMQGSDRKAGAVAGSSRIKNPISAAKLVMEKTNNVLLSGEGADWFAIEQGLDIVNPLYFITEGRWRSTNKAYKRSKQNKQNNQATFNQNSEDLFGTIGAVVLDSKGNLTAGTSTGGRTHKKYGRIGDSPIIGAGTYASNDSCAVSATGHGEYFMRYTVARDICARVEFKGESLKTSANTLVREVLYKVGGKGAIIAISPEGKVVFSMNGDGAYRGVFSSEISSKTAIYADQPLE